MTAPRWLTQPSPEELGAFGVAVLAGSVVTNAVWQARSLEEKGVLLMISGLSTIGLMVAVRALCETSERGACAYVPKDFVP